MKNKIMIGLLALVSAGSCAFGLAACGESGAHEHTYSEAWTYDGTRHWHSATCEHSEETSGAAEHAYGEAVITTPATCKETGTATYECTVCGYRYTETIPLVGHTYGEWIAEVAATHTADGVKGHYECSVCHQYFDAEYHQITDLAIPAATDAHLWNEGTVTKAATCEEEGRIEYTCTDPACGETKTETVPAKGHAYVWKEKVAATCEKDGVKAHYECSECGKYFDATKNEIQPESLVIAALGHDWGEWEEVTPATETADGVRKRVCNRCGKTETETIEAHVHTHADGDTGTVLSHSTVDTDLNITNGVSRYRCTVCGFEYEDEYDEHLTGIYGGVSSRTQKITSGGTYITFINTAYVKDEEVGVESWQPVDKYFTVVCNEEDGATYTINILYDNVAMFIIDNDNITEIMYCSQGAVSYSFILNRGETFKFALSADEASYDEDYLHSVIFSVDVGDPPAPGTIYRPIGITEGTFTQNAAAGEKVYYKMQLADLPQKIVLTAADGVSVYFLGFSLKESDEGAQIESGSVIDVSSYYYTTYFYAVSKTGKVSFTVENANVAGTVDNPIAMTLDREYTTATFSSSYQGEWYMFECTESGEYVWTGTSSNGGSPYAYRYTNLRDLVHYDAVGSGKIYLTLESGTTYYFRVEGDRNTQATVSITIREAYRVTFVSGLEGVSVDAQEVYEGAKVKEPQTPVYEGMIFIGWYTDAELTQVFNFSEVIIAADLTLYGAWEEGRVVTFVTGQDGVTVASQTVAVNGTATEPETPVCVGYTFVGWYADEELTQEFDFTASINSDITLYAKWEVVEIDDGTIKGSGTMSDPYIIKRDIAISANSGVAGNVYYKYTATANGTVTISVNADDEYTNVDIYLDGKGIGYINSWSGKISWELQVTAGQAVLLSVSYSDDDGNAAEGPIAFNVEIVQGSGTMSDPYAIKGDGTISADSGGGTVYYSYTASANGTLTVSLTDSNDENTSIEITVNGSSVYVDNYYQIVEQKLTLTAGQVVSIAVTYYDDSGNVAQGIYSFDIQYVARKGSKENPYTATIGTNDGNVENGDALILGELYTKYYQYTASANGTVTLLTDAADYDTFVFVSKTSYADAENAMYGGGVGYTYAGSTLTVDVAKGDTLYMLVGLATGGYGAYSFTMDFAALENGSSAYPYTAVIGTNRKETTNQDYYSESAESYLHYYIYEATAGGTLTITAVSENTLVAGILTSYEELYLFPEGNYMIGGITTNSIKLTVNAGDKVYILAGYYAGAGAYSFTMDIAAN